MDGRRAVKIQSSRQTPMSQSRRDCRQSVVSLAVIAVMLGGGDWSYTTLGWGFRPLPGILGTVISVVASLVLFDTWLAASTDSHPVCLSARASLAPSDDRAGGLVQQ
jgi:hypothetical protein